MVTAAKINKFWLEDVEPKAWYSVDPELDAEITDRFLEARNAAVAGALDHWKSTAEGSLALLILIDQFSRNMFRGDPRSFEGDAKAREIAREAIYNRQDLEVSQPGRSFFYLPFMHSETLADQDFGIDIQRQRNATEDDLLHAHAHREIIAEFGRFPFRNKALGRETTPAEEVFLEEGGYGAIVRKLQSQVG